MSPVTTETPSPGWGLGPTPACTVIYTGKLHHHRGRYQIAAALDRRSLPSLCELKGNRGANIGHGLRPCGAGPAVGSDADDDLRETILTAAHETGCEQVAALD